MLKYLLNSFKNNVILDVKMAAEVTAKLELGLMKQKGFTNDQAKSFISEMKENLRFHEDIFGNYSENK